MAVPIAAPLTVLDLETSPGSTPPTCELAKLRQYQSSSRNWSELFDVPGSAMTLGPLGMSAQAPRRSTAPMAVKTR